MAYETVVRARAHCASALVIAALGLGFPAVAAADNLVAWGENTLGQTAVPAGDDYVAVAAGANHSVALKRDGSLVAWGDDGLGQADVPPGSDYTAVAAGGNVSIAVDREGGLVAWGAPIDLPDGNGYTAVATNGSHVVALRRDGSLVGAGPPQLGLANVPDGSDFTAISVDLSHGLALRRDGSLAGWGSLPTQINGGVVTSVPPPTGNDFVAVAAGWNHGLAIKRDGSLVVWPKQDDPRLNSVPDGGGFVSLAGNWNINVALRYDGTVAAWPWAGVTGPLEVPVPNHTFTAVAVGYFHVVALQDNAPPTLTVPDTVAANATSPSGATVTYSVGAEDSADPALTPACAPASGSVFAIGTTTVTCTAADRFGHQASRSFSVVVSQVVAKPAPQPPACSVKLASRKVVVQRKRVARLRLTASCTQAMAARLSGRVTLHGRHVNVSAVRVDLAAGKRTSFSVKLPQRALTALRKRAHVTVALTLTATNAQGKTTAQVHPARLSFQPG
jgi:hypothetical protein